jgi:hypothetical protein
VIKGTVDPYGREGIRFYKDLSNGYVLVVEKVLKNSPNDMETITMWAEMSPEATNAHSKSAPDMDVRNAILSTDVAKIRKDAEKAILNDEKVREHRVFHGSGADFERFDHSHIGEGEGAQAYGWGSYVTEQDKMVRDELVNIIQGAGIDVDMEHGQEVLDQLNGKDGISKAQKRALETASVISDETHQPTVVSSADGAKVL